jgi:hypothetical protein
MPFLLPAIAASASTLRKLLPLSLLCAASLAHAASYSDVFSQAISGGRPSITGTATDAAGNSYVVGGFTHAGGVLSGSGLSLAPIGVEDGFVAKLDRSGNVLWAHDIGGSGTTTSLASVSLDPSGNVVVGGSFGGGNLSYPGLSRTSTASTSYDGVVIKFDSNGNLLWSKDFGGASASTLFSWLTTDAAGGIELAGEFEYGNTTNPALTKQSAHGYDSFAMKLDTNGNLVWARDIGGSAATTNSNSIAVDPSQNVYISGSFSSGNLTSPFVSKIGTNDAYVIKYDGNGNLQWARNYGGGGVSATAASVAVDALGDVALGGYFHGGAMTTPALPMVLSTDAYDAFAIKLNSAGTLQWARRFGGAANSSTFGFGIALDGSGNMVLGGTFNASISNPSLTLLGSSDSFAVELNSVGTTVWTMNMGTAGYNDFAGINGGFAADGTRTLLFSGIIYNNAMTTWEAVVFTQLIP